MYLELMNVFRLYPGLAISFFGINLQFKAPFIGKLGSNKLFLLQSICGYILIKISVKILEGNIGPCKYILIQDNPQAGVRVFGPIFSIFVLDSGVKREI